MKLIFNIDNEMNFISSVWKIKNCWLSNPRGRERTSESDDQIFINKIQLILVCVIPNNLTPMSVYLSTSAAAIIVQSATTTATDYFGTNRSWRHRSITITLPHYVV